MTTNQHILTIAQLEQMVGQGGNHITSHDAQPHVTLHDFPRMESVKERIYKAVAARDGWVSRADICKALGVKKASWVNVHLTEMVNKGILTSTRSRRPNGAKMYWYAINPFERES